MPPELIHRPITDNEPIGPIARLAALAFGYPDSETAEWFEQRVGRANIRITTTTTDPTPIGVVCRVPMGLYLAGKQVPQLGVLGVAVAPEARGRGIAHRMMARCIKEMHEDGYPLSALYSAMHPLYRAAGYENAGLLCDAVIPAGMIQASPRTQQPAQSWREAKDTDTQAIHDCYHAYAQTTHGMLARVEYLWYRIRNPKTGPTRCFVAENNAGTIEAYCYYDQEKSDATNPTTGNAAGARMRVADLAWSTPAGFESIRAFLRGFASIVGEIHCSLPPDSPLIHTLPDRRFSLTVREPWMLRILDVKTALESRGYPRGLTATLQLRITDDLIASNTGLWTLTVENGTPTAERQSDQAAAGDPLKVDIRTLAPIYTGFTSVGTLRAASEITASDDTAATADAIFATPSTPAMTNMF